MLWWEWKRDHPDTQVLAEDDRFKRYYFNREIARRGYPVLAEGFRRTIEVRDERLAPSSLCYGVAADGAARAYPFEILLSLKHNVINGVVGETPVVIIIDQRTRSAAGHGRVLDGKLLVFDRTEDGRLRDRASGSIFDRDDLAIAGELEGRRLPRINGLQTEWYGWFPAYPQTTIYAIADQSDSD